MMNQRSRFEMISTLWSKIICLNFLTWNTHEDRGNINKWKLASRFKTKDRIWDDFSLTVKISRSDLDWAMCELLVAHSRSKRPIPGNPPQLEMRADVPPLQLDCYWPFSGHQPDSFLLHSVTKTAFRKQQYKQWSQQERVTVHCILTRMRMLAPWQQELTCLTHYCSPGHRVFSGQARSALKEHFLNEWDTK